MSGEGDGLDVQSAGVFAAGGVEPALDAGVSSEAAAGVHVGPGGVSVPVGDCVPDGGGADVDVAGGVDDDGGDDDRGGEECGGGVGCSAGGGPGLTGGSGGRCCGVPGVGAVGSTGTVIPMPRAYTASRLMTVAM